MAVVVHLEGVLKLTQQVPACGVGGGGGGGGLRGCCCWCFELLCGLAASSVCLITRS